MTEEWRAMQPKRRMHLDVETRSTVELSDTNAYVYFAHPDTNLWLAAYAFSDDEEPKLWHPGEPCPEEIVDHVRSDGTIHCWNAAFERICWRDKLGPLHGWPVPKLENYRCTMAAAYALAFPGRLKDAAPALALDIGKDDAGERLMKKMAKPRRPRKGEPTDQLLWWDSPSDIARLGEYCRQDVRAEMACHSRLISLRPQEQLVWFLDQKIADRGVGIDKDLCTAARKIVAAAAERMDRELSVITDWDVSASTNTTQLRAWIAKQGFATDSVDKEAVLALLARDDLTPAVRRALEIRQEGGKTSTSKIDTMLLCRQADGRMRGNLQYHGASTGRWAARGAQLQNLPRNVTKKSELPFAIELVGRGSLRAVEIFFDKPMQVVSDCIRAMIQAAPGHTIMAADLASIEARVNQWLAGSDRALDVFRAYDRKEGVDPYIAAAAGVYNLPVKDIDDRKRLVGKVSVLALGFGGGPVAFQKMAKNYGLDISGAAEPVWASASPKNRQSATEAWGQRGKTTGMSEKSWLTAELIKLAWRETNSEVVKFWRDLEEGAIEAVRNKGKVVRVGATGKILYRQVGDILFCQLPSGRCIAYPYPRIVTKEMPWTDAEGDPVFRPALTVKGVKARGTSKKWCEYDFYGGLACENVTQAAARDIMAEGMMRVDEAGYPVVITIHDEVVAEPKIGFGSLEEFENLMTTLPTWAAGLPVAAEAWSGERYRK